MTTIIINNNKDKDEKEKKSNQSTHFTKPRNPPDWTKNMKYEIYREHVESWSDNHKDLNENYRFQLLIEVLRKNNAINGLGTYVNTKVVGELRNKSKQTVENVIKELVKEILDFKILGGEKAEDVLDNISKVRSMINEEKMNANMDLFVLTIMMMKAKESRIFSDGKEIVLKQIIKRHADSPDL